jgi:uncharacterized protein YjbI with pentapeptide repeats
MHRFILFLLATLAATSSDASSYQKTDGTIVDPLHATQGGNLVYSDYSGPNLEPDANLKNVELPHAFLWVADLTNVNLSSADLSGAFLLEANLSGADLSDANLSWAGVGSTNLSNANLTGADLTQAILGNANLEHANVSGATFTDVEYWNSATWTNSYYYTDNEPTWASGMDTAWRSSVGILAIDPNLIPEPATLLLALLAMASVPHRVRCG